MSTSATLTSEWTTIMIMMMRRRMRRMRRTSRMGIMNACTTLISESQAMITMTWINDDYVFCTDSMLQHKFALIANQFSTNFLQRNVIVVQIHQQLVEWRIVLPLAVPQSLTRLVIYPKLLPIMATAFHSNNTRDRLSFSLQKESLIPICCNQGCKRILSLVQMREVSLSLWQYLRPCNIFWFQLFYFFIDAGRQGWPVARDQVCLGNIFPNLYLYFCFDITVFGFVFGFWYQCICICTFMSAARAEACLGATPVTYFTFTCNLWLAKLAPVALAFKAKCVVLAFKQSVLHALSNRLHVATICISLLFLLSPYFRSDSEKFSQSLSSFCCPRLSKRIYVLIFRLVTLKGNLAILHIEQLRRPMLIIEQMRRKWDSNEKSSHDKSKSSVAGRRCAPLRSLYLYLYFDTTAFVFVFVFEFW